MQERGWQALLRCNWGYLVATLLAALVCMPAIGGEPIWDDVIVFERFLPSFGGLADALFPPPNTGELGSHYYRPLVTVSYMLDRWLGGSDAYYVDHLTVMLFHALTTLGVGLLAQRLIGATDAARWAGFAASLAFAVHPVHVDSVAQISGRCDPMAGAFMVWSALFVLHGRDQPQRTRSWVLAAVTLLLGLFSKEVAAVSIPLGALLLVANGRVAATVWQRFAIAYGVTAALYVVLRASAPLQSTIMLQQSFGEAFERLVRAVGYDLKMMVTPWPQAAFVPFDSIPSVWASVARITLVGVAGFAIWRRRRSHPVLVIGLCWYLLALVPVLALLFVQASEQPVAERYLYVPSIGFCIGFGWLVAWAGGIARWRVPIAIAAFVLIAIAAVQTSMRSRIYGDKEAFWMDTVAKAPEAALPRYQLGVHFRLAGDHDKARQHLQWALDHYQDAEGRSLALNTLGTIHLERKEFEAAEQRFLAATNERPTYASPWFNLAGVYGMRAQARRGSSNEPNVTDMEKCVHALGMAVEVRPNYRKARVQLAQQLLQLTQVYVVLRRQQDVGATRARAKVAAEWLIARDPNGAHGQLGRKIVNELGRLR